MDGIRVDEETCGVAAAGPGRRGVLKGLAAGGLVAAVGRLTGRPAEAKKKKPKGPCNGKCGTLCEKRTGEIRCDPANEGCVCIRSTSGKIQCADSSVECPPPGSTDQCQRDADCDPDQICVATAGGACCSDAGHAQVNICVPVCLQAMRTGKSGQGAGLLPGLGELLSRH